MYYVRKTLVSLQYKPFLLVKVHLLPDWHSVEEKCKQCRKYGIALGQIRDVACRKKIERNK